MPIEWAWGIPELDSRVRGLRELRVIAHLHSHWSHDACDGNPQPGGVPDEECLADLRYGLCTTKIDLAFLSDHPTHAEEATLPERLLNRNDDELVLNDAGDPVGAWLRCDDGHETLMLPGLEDDLMPFGMEADAPDASETRTPENVQALRDAGAVVWHAHTEERTYEEMAPLGLDGMELYQLHANLDPNSREDYLGLEPFSYLGEVAPFFFPENHGLTDPPHPDLAPLGFVVPNEPAAVMLETVGLEQRIGSTAGTDAHQNVFPADAIDGERIDSYRRMMRWFNNRLRIDGELTPESARDAMREARLYMTFEVFGTPLDFDFFARQGGDIPEIGGEVSLSDGEVRLHVDLPTLDDRSPRSGASPEMRGVLYFADETGRTVIQEWTEGALDVVADDPGVYRVEVWLTPLHLEPYLGEVAVDFVSDEVLWIQTGAIFVRE